MVAFSLRVSRHVSRRREKIVGGVRARFSHSMGEVA